MAPDVAELRAHVVRAVLDVVAAVERGRVAVLVLEPLVLGRLELGRTLARRGIRKAIVHVVGEGSRVVVGARSARLVHKGREHVARADAGAALLLEIARDDAGNLDHNIGIVHEIALAVESDLRFGAETDGRVEGLVARLDGECRVLRIAQLPEGEGRVEGEIGVDGAGRNKIGESAAGHLGRLCL